MYFAPCKVVDFGWVWTDVCASPQYGATRDGSYIYVTVPGTIKEPISLYCKLFISCRRHQLLKSCMLLMLSGTLHVLSSLTSEQKYDHLSHACTTSERAFWGLTGGGGNVRSKGWKSASTGSRCVWCMHGGEAVEGCMEPRLLTSSQTSQEPVWWIKPGINVLLEAESQKVRPESTRLLDEQRAKRANNALLMFQKALCFILHYYKLKSIWMNSCSWRYLI